LKRGLTVTLNKIKHRRLLLTFVLKIFEGNNALKNDFTISQPGNTHLHKSKQNFSQVEDSNLFLLWKQRKQGYIIQNIYARSLK
jgi:hypothetical protein